MKVVILLVFAFTAVALSEKVSYKGYKVYDIILVNEDQREFILNLQKDLDIDVWDQQRKLGTSVVLLVSPELQSRFESYLKIAKIKSKILIEDVEKTIVREESEQKIGEIVRSSKADISFKMYNRHSTINTYLNQLASEYPDIASVITIGKSFEGRDINILHVSTGGNGKKPAILVDGGIHAREWIAPAQVLYIIQQLVENRAANKDLTDKLDWYILPVVNPDGYEYSHSTDRFWRKTRSSRSGGVCKGTDGNRNFEFHWMEIGASSQPCSETYAGPTAFSEVETQVLRDFGLKIKAQAKMYLTFHSYGNYILYPWGYTSALPNDVKELQALGESVNEALGNSYTVGSSTNVLYPAAGGSDDWFKGVAGIQLSYTIELPGGGSQGFDLPPHLIEPVVTETYEGVKVFGNYVIEKFA